jgi:hypothetical protein
VGPGLSGSGSGWDRAQSTHAWQEEWDRLLAEKEKARANAQAKTRRHCNARLCYMLLHAAGRRMPARCRMAPMLHSHLGRPASASHSRLRCCGQQTHITSDQLFGGGGRRDSAGAASSVRPVLSSACSGRRAPAGVLRSACSGRRAPAGMGEVGAALRGSRAHLVRRMGCRRCSSLCRLRCYRAAMMVHWLRCTLAVGGAVGLRVPIMPIRVPIMPIRVPIMPIRVPTDDDGPPAVLCCTLGVVGAVGPRARHQLGGRRRHGWYVWSAPPQPLARAHARTRFLTSSQAR